MKKKTALPIWLITVTPLSKSIALVLVIALPFIGFVLGKSYAEYLNPKGNTVYPTYTPYKPNLLENKVEKTTKPDGTLEIKLTLVGTIENLNVTDINIPYRYKIVLDKPITDKDAIADARGEDLPKREYILLTYDEESVYKLNDNIGKKFVIEGTLEWGFAESRYLKIDSIKLL